MPGQRASPSALTGPVCNDDALTQCFRLLNSPFFHPIFFLNTGLEEHFLKVQHPIWYWLSNLEFILYSNCVILIPNSTFALTVFLITHWARFNRWGLASLNGKNNLHKAYFVLRKLDLWNKLKPSCYTASKPTEVMSWLQIIYVWLFESQELPFNMD